MIIETGEIRYRGTIAALAADEEGRASYLTGVIRAPAATVCHRCEGSSRPRASYMMVLQEMICEPGGEA